MANSDLGKKSIDALLIEYSLPAVMGMIVSALYNIVDRIFIGNISEIGSISIAGLGATLPITTIITAFSMLIAVGSSNCISISLGQGDSKKGERIMGTSLFYSLLIGLIIGGLGYIFQEKILEIFGATKNSLEYGKIYITPILCFTPINMAGYLFVSLMRSDGSPKFSAKILGISCLLNIFLDWVFVFKFQWGIAGAAYATVISQFLTFTTGLFYFTKISKCVRLKKVFMRPEINLIFAVASIGAAPFINQLLASTVQTLNNNFLKIEGGEYAVGAMAVIGSISILCLMPIQGVAQGAQPIIAYNYGAGNYARSKETLKKSIFTSLILTISMVIAVEIFPEKIISLFGKNSELGEIALQGLKIYILGMPAIAVGMNSIHFFQAIGFAKSALLFSLLRQVFILIPSLVIFSKKFGLIGIWSAQPFSDYLSMVVILYFLYNVDKKRR